MFSLPQDYVGKEELGYVRRSLLMLSEKNVGPRKEFEVSGGLCGNMRMKSR